MAKKLKPCPFCGGRARLVVPDPENEPEAVCVECQDCQASSALRYSLKEDARPLVIEAWNGRVGSRRAEGEGA